MEKEVISIIAIIILNTILIISLESYFTIDNVFENSGNDFNNGTFQNTEYNGTGIVLSGQNFSGLYISKIFDAGFLSRWNNLTWKRNTPKSESLYAVDGAGDVYASSNSGVNWTQKIDNYGRTTDTTHMFSNEYLFIISNSNKEVWRSINGSSFSVVNNSFADSNLFVGDSDSQGNLYIVDSSGDVYYSSDNGINWEKRGDFNSGATNDAKGISINSSDALFIVDGSGAVYLSIDNGNNWTQQTTNYGGGSATNGMIVDNSSYLYILKDKKLWKSTNKGVTWTKISDPFTSYSNDGCVIAINDNKDEMYIADCTGRIFNSTNQGINWQELGDLNGAATNNPKGLTNFILSTNLTIEVRNCSLSDCSNGAWQSVNLTNINLTSRYFQYKINFTRQDIILNPIVMNVSIDYTILNSAPSLLILSPQNISYNYRKNLSLNYSVSDNENNLESCWYNLNNGNNITLSNCLNASLNFSTNGSFTLNVFTNDSQGAESNNSVTFFLLNTYPLLNITSPQNISYDYGKLINLNFTYSDNENNIDSCWYNLNNGNNITLVNCQNTTLNITKGNYLLIVYVNDSLGLVSSDNVNFSVINNPPTLTIISPQEGATYGTNVSIKLNYSVSDNENNIDSCWYNLNNGNNLTIINCQNTSFNVSGNGNYRLQIFANDSLGEIGSNSLNFTIEIGSPTIILHFPINIYINHNNITLNYTPSDIDLDSCELWGDFDGTFKLNKTNLFPVNNQINNFKLNLSDGIYSWNIKCNDTLGNYAFNGNKTFYVDTINPGLTLNEPKNTKSSRIDIPLQFQVSDSSPISCLYNVYRGGNIEVINTSINCSLQSVSFNVTVDADFILNFYVNDSAGNVNYTSSSFTIDSSVSDGGGGGGGGGSGGGSSSGGGGGNVIGFGKSLLKNITKIEFSKLGEVLTRPGDKKTLSINARNTGNVFLNNCKLLFNGEITSWIFYEKIKGISPGEVAEFIFELTVPQTAEEKSYSVNLEFKCDEISETQEMLITLQQKNNIEIKEIKQEKNSLNITYLFDSLNLIEDNVDIDIWLVDDNGNKILSYVDSFSINKEDVIERKVSIELPDDLSGIFTVNLALTSELDNSVKQTIVIGKSKGIGGITILDTTKGKITGYFIFAIIILIGVILIIKKSYEKKDKKLKSKNRKNSYKY